MASAAPQLTPHLARPVPQTRRTVLASPWHLHRVVQGHHVGLVVHSQHRCCDVLGQVTL